MKRVVLVAVGLVGLLVVASCGDGNSGTTTVELSESAAAGISVTGTGQVYGAPDTLTLNIGVSVTEATVDAANDQAAASSEAVIDALVSEGVDRDDIQTQQFQIYPQFDFSGEREELVGYTVTNTVVAKLRDVETAGATIDAAIAAGGDDTVVQGVGFSVEDDTERLAEARARAWADAEAKAAQLADLAGVGLGSAIEVSEGVSRESGPLPQFGSFDAAAESVPIEAGQVASTVILTVRFAVET